MSKVEKLTEYLKAPWHTFEPFENGVRIVGMTKNDQIELDLNDLKIVAKLLRSDDKKVSFGAINILKEFGEKAQEYSSEIIEQFHLYDENQQIEIVKAIITIVGKESYSAYDKLLNQDLLYDVLLNILFRASLHFEEKPIEGLELVLKSSKNESMWIVVKDFVRKALNKPLHEEKGVLDFDLELRPAIGISQEAEMKRGQLKGLEENIIQAIIKIRKMEKSTNKTEHKDAKKLLKELNKLK